MERFIPLLGMVILGLTLYVNYLAGLGYINNINTGEVSSMYPTLFTPAGFTFAIWGLIYLLNILFIGAQIYKMIRLPQDLDIPLNGIFILICLTNAVWIFSWHLMKIGMALLLMVAILSLLIYAYKKVRQLDYGSYSYFFEYINFSIYLGWISVATVANTAIFLTQNGLLATGALAAVLTAVVMAVIVIIAVWMILREGNIYYGLVILWASYGIVLARTADAVAGASAVSVVALIAMALIFLALVYRAIARGRALR